MIIIDTETGGLSANENPILSVGAIDTESGQEWSAKITPSPRLRVDARAAEINGYDPETWGGIKEDLAAGYFMSFIHERDEILAGANIRFDINFLTAWIVRAGYKKPFWPRLIDLQSLALNAHQRGRITLPRKETTGQLSFSLDSVCKAVFIKRTETHDALQDARDTAKAIERINTLSD